MQFHDFSRDHSMTINDIYIIIYLIYKYINDIYIYDT